MSQFFKTYEDTNNWLDKMDVWNYKINQKDLTVDLDGGKIDLSNKNIEYLPVKFGKVKVNGKFVIYNNPNLKSLKGVPDSCDEIDCTHTGIKNFNGLGSVKRVAAGRIESLESFEGLPSELEFLYIDESCHNVGSLEHFPKIITNYLCIDSDFKWTDSLYKYTFMCGCILIAGRLEKYKNILKLLYVGGLKGVRSIDSSPGEVFDILNAEIRRQPDPRKRNILKVAQELSNAGYHHLTV